MVDQQTGTRYLIYGSGGTSRDIAEALERCAIRMPISVVGFIDDNADLKDREIFGLRVLGGSDIAFDLRFVDTSIVIGVANEKNPFARRALRERVDADDKRFPSVVDPLANVSIRCAIGCGSVVLGGTACSHNARLGRHVIVLQNCLVGHDSTIEDFATIAPCCWIGGFANIGEGAYLGGGARIAPRVKVGAGAFVGCGSVVIEDVPPGHKVFGNPARKFTA